MPEAKLGFAIGIDFGTSKCCVGVVRNGKVEIVENERGNKTTPSYVSFTDSQRLVGDGAKDNVTLNPKNTIYSVKRFMGMKHAKNVPIYCPNAFDSKEGKLTFKVDYRQQNIELFPEQISAMLLKKMKDLAENHLNCSVEDAVISVPTHFNNSQRQATVNAARIAGLNVLSLINEPTAAAVAYLQDKLFRKQQKILIFGLGAGTLDYSIFDINNDNIEMMKNESNEFGGFDIDDILARQLIGKINESYSVNIVCGTKSYERIRIAVQDAKHGLSLLPKTIIHIPNLVNDNDYTNTFMRTEMESYLQKIQEKLPVLLKSFSEDSTIEKVVLMGGSSRIPFILDILIDIFGEEKINKTINPDEAAAIGAALSAASLLGGQEISTVTIEELCLKESLRYRNTVPPTENDSLVNMMQQVSKIEEDDIRLKECIVAMARLETKCFAYKKKLADLEDFEASLIIGKCNDVLDLLEDNEIVQEKDIIEKSRMLDDVWGKWEENIILKNNPQKNLNDSRSRTQVNNPQPRKQVNDPKPMKHVNDPQPRKQMNDPQPMKHVNDPQPRKQVNDLQPRKQVNDPQPMKHVNDLQQMKHVNDLQPMKVKQVNNPPPHKIIIDAQPGHVNDSEPQRNSQKEFTKVRNSKRNTEKNNQYRTASDDKASIGVSNKYIKLGNILNIENDGCDLNSHSPSIPSTHSPKNIGFQTKRTDNLIPRDKRKKNKGKKRKLDNNRPEQDISVSEEKGLFDNCTIL